MNAKIYRQHDINKAYQQGRKDAVCKGRVSLDEIAEAKREEIK